MKYHLVLFLLFSFFAVKAQTIRIEAVSTDPKYGVTASIEKAVKVGSIENEMHYINALTGPKGEPVSAERVGSCCGFKSKNTPLGKASLDIWEVTYPGLSKPVTLYLNGYEYEKPLCPIGLGIKRK